MKKAACWVIGILSSLTLGANPTQTVTTVNTAVTLSTPVDYHITSATPIGGGGTIDLAHEEAWLFLDNCRPSKVQSDYLPYLTVKGAKAELNKNVRVDIYRHGAMVIPHGTDYRPLTVYTGENYTGESKNDFTVFTYYKALGNFNNAIRSFKLKRGYMATLANNANGTGFSRCFIANNGDVEVPLLQDELAGRVSFIRVFRWHEPSKKGWTGSDANDYGLAEATWRCDWSAGGSTTADVEYVPHRHHIGWPSYSSINGVNNSTHVLGDNEPDNQNDDREANHTVSEVLAQWEGMYESGLRVGSPACTSANSWLYNFVDSCDRYGYRLDFVALHCYWYNSASSWKSQLDYIHSRTKRPLWITEMNYGANWTGWDNGDDRSASAANQEILRARITDILNTINGLDYLERYAFYNWVQDCRAAVLNGSLTPGGKVYANSRPRLAYSADYEKLPTWNYYRPTDLTTVFSPTRATVALTWNDRNVELTDSSIVERSADGGKTYKTLGTVVNRNVRCTFTDSLKNGIGQFIYRIRAHNADGKVRYSGTSNVDISGSEGPADFQYGQISTSSTDYTYNYYGTPFEELPVILFGPVSYTNMNVPLCHHLYAIKKNYFQYRYFPWSLSDYQTLSKEEKTSYLALKRGNGAIGSLTYEAVQIDSSQMDKGYAFNTYGKVGKDTAYIHFRQPFPEGTQPVVILNVLTTRTSYPLMWKVTEVTNKGFKLVLNREAGRTEKTFINETVLYLAIAQGNASLGNGKRLTVGYKENAVGGIAARLVEFNDSLSNPLLWGELQTARESKACILRYTSLSETGVRIKRQIDTSEKSTSSSIYDDFGWIAISDEPVDDAITAPEKDTALPFSTDGQELILECTGETVATLYTIAGQAVQNLTLAQGENRISLTALPQGCYLLKTSDGHQWKFMRDTK